MTQSIRKYYFYLAAVLASFLALRDYIFVFNDSLSYVISILLYVILFFAFYIDVVLFSGLKLPKKMAVSVFLILITTAIHVSSYPILTIFLFVCFLRNFKLEEVLSLFFWPRLLMSMGAIILYQTGVTHDVSNEVSYKLGGGIFHTMGLSDNPNTTASYFFSAILLVYLYGKVKHKKILFVVPLLTVIYITKVTMSRTVLLSTIMLYLFDFLFRCKKNNLLVRLSLLLPFFCLFGTVILAYVFPRNTILNALFSLRPLYWHNYFVQSGTKGFLFGTGTSFEVTVDSGYIRLFIFGGVLLYIPFLYLLKQAMHRRQKKDSPYFVFLLAVFSFSFMESVGMTQLRDISVLTYLILYRLMLENREWLRLTEKNRKLRQLILKNIKTDRQIENDLH